VAAHNGVGQVREDGPRAVLTTRLRYQRKVAARAVWLSVGPLHRILAPLLMRRSTRRGVVPADVTPH